MSLLTRPAPKPPPPRSPAPLPNLVIGMVEDCVEARLAGTMVAALPEGALWIEAGRALVVSDLHFEKGSSFARHGRLLPPYDTRATLMRIARLMDLYAPDIVVSLGDSFHDGGGPARMAEVDRALLASLMGRCDWIWVEGNHEGRAAQTLGGESRDVLHIGPLMLRHEPRAGAAPGEIAGHLHPCARVAGRGQSVRRSCFAYDGERLIMPAFGAYTGGLNILDPTFAPIFPDGAMAFVLAKDRVLPAPQERLLSD